MNAMLTYVQYIHTYIATYIIMHIYIHSYMDMYIPTYIRTYIHNTYIHMDGQTDICESKAYRVVVNIPVIYFF